jgi:hypothetical protein
MTPSDDDFTPAAQAAFSSGPPRPPTAPALGATGDSDDEARSLYQSFLREKPQIESIRENESTRAGHDIGFEKAVNIWTGGHRQQWLKENGHI